MGVEIERRFRVDVKRLAPNGEDGKALPKGRYYKQAYLAEDPSIRVRVVGWDENPIYNEHGISAATMTIKGKGTVERAEWNLMLPHPDAFGLMALAKFGVIEKIRVALTVVETKWELDRFVGVHEGLWLAEVELPSVDASFDRPPWLGEEVTADSRFTNARLAQTAGRFWDET